MVLGLLRRKLEFCNVSLLLTLKKLINPKITEFSGEELGEEGCLSLPDFRAIVRRATEVSVDAKSIDGKSVIFSAQGLMARVLQHEIDHLDGILITDRLLSEDQELLQVTD